MYGVKQRVLLWARRLVAVGVLAVTAACLSGLLSAESPLLFFPKTQFAPAVLAAVQGSLVGLAVAAVLVLLTLLFGRVYCSWLCPLGVLQDIVNRLRRPFSARRKGARYGRNLWWLRAAVLLVVVGAFALGCNVPLMWTEPYTLAARAFSAAWDFSRYEGITLLFIGCAVAVPLLLALLAGRLYCNTLCPVGAALGALACKAPFAPQLNKESCKRCGTCMKVCKAAAIDVKNGRVDKSRCVGCYRCLAACPHHALTLLPPSKKHATPPQEEPVDETRRALLGLGLFGTAAALLPAPARAAEEAVARTENTAPAAVPAGAGDTDRFLGHCTGCGLCIANCPTGVLRPAWTAHGWTGITKPYLSYGEDDVFCRYDCHTCSSLCPEGALMPLSLAEKQHTCVALAVHHAEHCTPWNTGYDCGRCAEACPTGAMSLHPVHVPLIKEEQCTGCRRCARTCPQGAISMVEVAGRERKLAVIDRNKCIGCGNCAESCRRHALESRRTEVPAFRPELCTGCGACHAACPATPQRAITMQPLRRHTKISTKYEGRGTKY